MMITALYADGGVIGHNPSDIGGTWAWAQVDETGTRMRCESGVVLPRASVPLITNNLTELIALVKGLESLPAGWAGIVYSDSQITIGRVFWGWALNNIPPVLAGQMNAARLRLNMAHCTAVLLDGHPTKAQLLAGIGKRNNPVSEHNVWCDKECGRRAHEHLALARVPAELAL